LAQALRTLVRQILTKSGAEVDRWRCVLTEAIEPNGQLIVSLVPEVEFIIGKQPPVPDLPPRDAQNRFQLVLRRFINVFARPEHPLVLFFDDLQWLDAATLDLLEHLATHSEVRHLLLVGAYRDNEVSPSHPLLRTLDAIRKAGGRVEEIVLAPLGLEDVAQLVADAIHCEPEHARPLAQLVQEKAGGNPLFAIQFFTALAEEGLLSFEPVTRAWQWSMDRIRAKSYTDNVVDLMAAKLKRLSPATQDALRQFASLGNVAAIANLALIQGTTEEALHAALREACHAGLVYREESAYKFLHDRIQQAAYSLIPDEQRADVHLRIGRALLASMTPDEIAEHLFDVASQFNRGAARLIDRGEKAQVAEIDLRAGRKAKASAAYASANVYLAAGMAQLDEAYWASHYELMFSLRLECAACEFLTGEFDTAEQLLVELLERAAAKVDRAAVYHQKILLHTVKSENTQAVDTALTCLRLFGFDLPAHPTWEQVQAEYETIWQILDGRRIESLIDLPLMTDPELQAAMQVLSTLLAPAYFTDSNLFCLLICRMVNVSTQHGMCGASTHGCAYLGIILGPLFHRYGEGYRFGMLACDLVDKHGFTVYRAKVHYAMGTTAFWTQPTATAIDFTRTSFRAAVETGDLTAACYDMYNIGTLLLLRNDPLDAVWRESEMALDFAREAKYGDAVDIIRSQQRFVATMLGRTATFSTFSDAQFNETAFEAQLTADRMALKICWYWILKLKARFLSGDYDEALAAADKAKALLWTSSIRVQLLEYFYYTALTVAALYENATADEQNKWREVLMAHLEQLREWADNYPPTFGDKYALVSAEVARLEGRDTDAMRLYDQAIRSARDHGFVQNEGLAHEVAARFYAARGVQTIADACLRNARSCYLRWGADGKVRQLDRLHPHLAAAEGNPSTATIGSPIQQLDVASIVKTFQAVSSEIELPKLIERLMTIALENAGADRGLLILPEEHDHLIQAEAKATGDQVEVVLYQKPITGVTCPESLVRYVIRAHESVILDDASRPNLFSEDDYLLGRRFRSILCLPLIKQGQLIGLLYLENTLTSHAFTPDRIAVLELLAAQAAIALENTRLYGDLQEREAKVRRLVDSNIIGIFIWDFEGRIIEANEAFLQMVGYSNDDLISGRLSWTALTPKEWRGATERGVATVTETGSCKAYEKEYLRKDGSRVPILVGGATFGGRRDQGVAFVLDLTERKQAEEERGANLWLLESLDKVNKAIQGTNDLEQMTSAVLDEVLSIFACDRAWLVYPCDPEASSWCATMEHTRPNFPGAFALGVDLSMDADVANMFRAARARDGAVQFHSESERPVPTRLAETFSIKSVIGMALYPKVDKPYMLGLHQCSHPRVWTALEERAFEEVGRRLGDALTGLLILRNLRQSEGKLEEAQRIARVGHWNHDLDTDLRTWSDENYRIFGLQPQARAITRELLREFIHPEDFESAAQARSNALRGGPPYDVEYRVVRPDGDVRIVHARGNVMRDESGRPRRIFGTVQDITERRHVEEALRERAQLLDLTHDSIFVRSMNDAISFWNQGAEQLYGWNKKEALGQVSHQLLRTIFPAPLDEITAEVLSTRRWEGELVHTKRNGMQVTVASRWSLREDTRGRPVGILETNNDITERKRAEYLTGHVFESSPDSMCIIGKDYRLQRVNPIFERLWEKPAATAVGMHIAEVLGTELFERHARSSLDRCFAGEEVSVADWYAAPLGRKYWVITHSPLRPTSQRVEAALLIARDFTDYVQAAEALRAAQTELAHVNRVTTMGQLTASIAHEVNQPIAAVVSNADAALRWLGRAPPELEEIRRSLNSIIKDSIRAGNVVDRIRALVKKTPPRNDPLDCNEAVREVVEVTRSELLRNNVSLKTELATGLPLVRGDRIQLQQVVLNLIMNAVEAMSDVSNGPRELLVSTMEDKPNGVLVAVRDSGPGLNPESLERLFDPFYTTKPSGMGMGLSICRSILEAHGGRLWAGANVPHGASFHFTLPLHRENAQ
jgi:PAS domain S-box-containing protein